MTPAILLDDITFQYSGADRAALEHIALEVPAGAIHAVVGPAGAGKSTLCALVAGYMPQFFHGEVRGHASVVGQDVLHEPVGALIRHVGLVGPDSFSQISGARFSVYEELAFGLENLGLPVATIRERVEWALSALKLGELRDRSPFALSGGQQQRMVIAAALALRPAVLVLDEPTAQLDPYATAELADLLRALAHQGSTILVAEHRLEWAAALSDSVTLLEHGRISATGAPAAVLADPALMTRGVGLPRPAALALRARNAGQWPAAAPLPVTLDGLVDGMRAATRSGGAHPCFYPAVAPLAPTVPPGPPVVVVEGVHYRYPSGVAALRGVSLNVSRGERLALLGRNGAGKSTLLRHLNGLRRPSAGRVLVAGADTRKLSVARAARSVGLVFQDVRNQLFARSVRDELRYGPRNLGLKAEIIDERVAAALATLGLAEVADEHPYDVPLATRRLVAVAAALTMDPALLVLDEPTAGLDSAAVERLVALIHDRAAAGGGVLVVSHDLDFCRDALERVVLMRAGQIVLDRPWSLLDAADCDLLEHEVGLPMDLLADRLSA